MQVKKALLELQKRKFVLIYDDDSRERETDLVIASEFVSPESIKTMRKDGGGLICTTISDKARKKLGLPFLTEVFSANKRKVFKALIPNDIPYDTKSAFSITINHRKTFTGITDCDRALTISEFAKLIKEVKNANNGVSIKLFGERFRTPGHVHLLNCSENLLQTRRGHTELSTALVIMANLTPSATICEMIGDNCVSLEKSKARKYAEKNNLVFLEGNEILEEWDKYYYHHRNKIFPNWK